MPKRAAPPSEPKTNAKRAKSSATKDKTETGLLATAQSAIETVAAKLSDVGAAVEAAGDLMLDQPASAPVSRASAKGKKGKKAAAPVDEITKENVTGVVDAAAQLVRDAGDAAAPYVAKISDAVAPILAGAEEAVVDAVEPLVQKGKKAMKKGRKAVAETPVVDEAVKKGKKVVEEAEPVVKEIVKKGKKAVEEAEPVAKEAVKKGKKAAVVVDLTAKDVVKKGKKVAADAEPVVKDTVTKGKQVAAETADEVVKKGKKAAEKAEPVVKDAVKKGKKAVEEAEPVVKDTVKKGKKAAVKTKDEVVKEGKKAAEDAEPVAKKARKTAAETKAAAAEKASQAAEDAESLVKETAQKGKKAAAAATEAVSNPKKRKTASDAMEGVETAVRDVVEVVVPASKRSKPTSKGKGKASEAEAEAEESEEDAAFIHGFSSSDGGADSSDDESDDEDAAIAKAQGPTVTSQLPPAKDDKSIQDKLAKARKKKDNQKGTLYLSRIPHGFYEDEMRAYFSQFGDVGRLRLARNRKTGASKHYAYIEMSSNSVAEIVAETMNNYLLNGHILKCSVIAPDDVHPNLWVGANKKWRAVPADRLEKARRGKERSESELKRADDRILAKQAKRNDKIKAQGIDYEFDGYSK